MVPYVDAGIEDSPEPVYTKSYVRHNWIHLVILRRHELIIGLRVQNRI